MLVRLRCESREQVECAGEGGAGGEDRGTCKRKGERSMDAAAAAMVVLVAGALNGADVP